MMNKIEARVIDLLNKTLARVAQDAQAGKLDEDTKKCAAAKIEASQRFAEAVVDTKIELTEHDGFKYEKEPTGMTTEQSVIDMLNGGLEQISAMHGLFKDDVEEFAIMAIQTAHLFAEAILCRNIELTDEDGFVLR